MTVPYFLGFAVIHHNILGLIQIVKSKLLQHLSQS